jgi:hypothetical protein
MQHLVEHLLVHQLQVQQWLKVQWVALAAVV